MKPYSIGLERFREWLNSEPRPPSNIAFTEGLWRDIAFEVEQYEN